MDDSKIEENEVDVYNTVTLQEHAERTPLYSTGQGHGYPEEDQENTEFRITDYSFLQNLCYKRYITFYCWGELQIC